MPKPKTKKQTQAGSARIRDRIVELRRVKASELSANPRNWRLHPDDQKGALAAMLEDVGFVGTLIARQLKDGSLELLDGHLRADVAGDEEVPVVIVDLNDQEAARVLATYDPLSDMAETDSDILAELLEDAEFGDDNAYMRKLLTDLHNQLEKEEKAGDLASADREIPEMGLRPHEHYDYLVVLATTTHDWNVLCDKLKLVPEKRRKRMGTCRAIHASRLLQMLKSDD